MSGLRIRITGIRQELSAAVAVLTGVLVVRVLDRVCLDAELGASGGAVCAAAERTDRPARPTSRPLTRRTTS